MKDSKLCLVTLNSVEAVKRDLPFYLLSNHNEKNDCTKPVHVHRQEAGGYAQMHAENSFLGI